MEPNTPPAPPGIYPGMPESEYRPMDAMNWSTLKLSRRSLAHMQHSLRNPRRPSPEMIFGTRAHEHLLEPDVYESRYVVMPDLTEGIVDPKTGKPYAKPRASKVYREAVAEWELENAGRETIDEADDLAIRSMAHKVRSEPEARGIAEAPQREVVVVAELLGVVCKGKLDGLDAAAGVVWDYKTAKTAEPEPFKNDAWRLGYFGQAAFYVDLVAARGCDVREFRIVAQEKEAPYEIAVYRIGPDELAIGRSLYESLLSRYSCAKAARTFPGYGDGAVINLVPPAWACRDAEGADAPAPSFESVFGDESA